MASMALKMKEKAIKASDATRCREIVHSVSRADVIALNRTMEPIIRQNERERIASEQAVVGTIFGGES